MRRGPHLWRARAGFAMGRTLALVAAAALVGWPLAGLLASSAGHYAEVFGGEASRALVRRSLVVSGTAAVVAAALGALVAYGLARADLPGRRLLAGACLLPLFAPPFVASLGLRVLFGDGGALTGNTLTGAAGIVLAQVIAFLPHAVLATRAALDRAEPALEEAAESLGAGDLAVLGRITWPMLRPGFGSALVVVFVLSLSDFANPLVIGGDTTVLASEVYWRATGAGDLRGAAALGVGLAMPCLVAWAVHRAWLHARHREAAPPPAGLTRRLPGWMRGTLLAVTAGSAATITLAWAAVIAGSLTGGGGERWPPTLHHYRMLLDPAGARPLLVSLELAALVAFFGSILALGLGWAVARHPGPGGRALEVASALPAALPGPVIGLGYLITFSGPPLLLAGTVWILVACTVAWKLPAAVRIVAGRLGTIEPSLAEVAQSLGGGPLQVLSRVTLPSLAAIGPPLVAGLVLQSLLTVGAVALLAPPGAVPATVSMLGAIERGELGGAAALGVAVTVLAALAGAARGRIGAADRGIEPEALQTG